MTSPENPLPEPQPSVWVAPRRTPSKTGLVVGVVAVVVALLGGAVAFASAEPDAPGGSAGSNEINQPLGIEGTLELSDGDSADNNCIGVGGYSDIRPGTQVTVLDGAGTILALSDLTLDQAATDAAKLTVGEYVLEMSCVYDFDVPNLPETDFYRINIGGGDGRGGITYSHQQLVDTGGRVSLSLGG